MTSAGPSGVNQDTRIFVNYGTEDSFVCGHSETKKSRSIQRYLACPAGYEIQVLHYMSSSRTGFICRYGNFSGVRPIPSDLDFCTANVSLRMFFILYP